MPDLITRDEYVEINNVPLATPAWEVVDLSPLWDAAPVRGDDRLIPYMPGKQPLRRIWDAWEVTLNMVIYGDQDREGTPYSDARVGLMTNIDVLRDELLDPDAVITDPGLKTLVLHMPDGSTRSADCHVIPPLNIAANLGPGTVRAALEIVIPSGVLELDGS